MKHKTKKIPPSGRRFARPAAACWLALLASCPVLLAREWTFAGIPKPVEAEFVAMANGYVVLRGSNDRSFEVPLTSFGPADRQYLKLLESGAKPLPLTPGKPVTRASGYKTRSVKSLTGSVETIGGATELHITGTGDPISGSTFNFTASDGWLFLDHLAPSAVISKFSERFRVNGARAVPDKNMRVVRHGEGTVVIPHPQDYPAMSVFSARDCGGESKPLKCHVKYSDAQLAAMKQPIRSFVLRRGYMATLAENENGTGMSRNYVAQDHDLVVDTLPKELDGAVRFVRVFPWRWTGKKGIGGGIHQNLNVSWFYDWNIGANSSPDLEYVAIKQKRWWPGLDQDWKAKGINHLLGFNEPDRPDQAKMTVDEAVESWPDLLGTGLRLGSPATSDGGLSWLYQFMEKAEARGLRVDFVPVHYYRAVGDPGDPRAASDQLYRYLKEIHDRVKRPLWVTEWNNGANWTKSPDPTAKQQAAAIRAMIRMLDETPFVERYALFNWVEDCRQLVRKDGSLTEAGEVYRDNASPVSFLQPRSGR